MSNGIIENNLSDSTTTYFSWAGSIIGMLIHSFCLYCILKKIKLNFFIKVIFSILAVFYLLSYLTIFISLIPILFYQHQDWKICTLIGYCIGSAGFWIQGISALISILRFYMVYSTSKNRKYKHWILVTSTIFTTLFILFFTISTTLSQARYRNYCSSEFSKNTIEPILSFIALIISTLLGIVADILMIFLLKRMKKVQGMDAKLVLFSSDNGDNYKGIVPRNSTLKSTCILFLAGFVFTLSKTMEDNLLCNVVISYFILPLTIKFTVSSKNKTAPVVVPPNLQFHEDSIDIGKFIS